MHADSRVGEFCEEHGRREKAIWHVSMVGAVAVARVRHASQGSN